MTATPACGEIVARVKALPVRMFEGEIHGPHGDGSMTIRIVHESGVLLTAVDRDTILALLERQTWQPIATAPKTNQHVLVWCPDVRCQFAVSWRDGHYYFVGGWQLTERPTLWRHMPPAPPSPPAPEGQ